MQVLGIDVGTQGVRVVACGASGRITAQEERGFGRGNLATGPGWFEQSPDDWWQATAACLSALCGQMRANGYDPSAIAGVSVTSTSGTLCVVDERGQALGNAIMYNDRRAGQEADVANQSGRDLAAVMGYRFSASFGLPKILWLREHQPDRYQAAHRFLSPTDFIIGRLTGEYGVTDYTNALKTGYDLIHGRWPDFIARDLGISPERLPRVVAPGTPVGAISPQAAREVGLRVGVPVFAGMTDGCASQVSTGAVAPGQWNSTLGTTLVIKGVSRELLRDPLGRIYCHRHPDGHWLPGGASNTGGDCIARHFDAAELDGLNTEALGRAPTGVIIYPLQTAGERFPFAKPQAEGFVIGQARDRATLYAAYLEGVGCVERLAYEVLAGLGAAVGSEVHAAGGATRSHAWLQIRADILDRAMLVPESSGGAMGAAIVAAGGTIHQGIVPAARAMVRIRERIEPRREMRMAYEDAYGRFRAACAERGYLD